MWSDGKNSTERQHVTLYRNSILNIFWCRSGVVSLCIINLETQALSIYKSILNWVQMYEILIIPNTCRYSSDSNIIKSNDPDLMGKFAQLNSFEKKKYQRGNTVPGNTPLDVSTLLLTQTRLLSDFLGPRGPLVEPLISPPVPSCPPVHPYRNNFSWVHRCPRASGTP